MSKQFFLERERILFPIALDLGRESFGGAIAAFVNQVFDNRFLGRKVIEERPDRDIRVAGNVAGRSLLEPLLGELLEGNF
jgi:hypothetical protein